MWTRKGELSWIIIIDIMAVWTSMFLQRPTSGSRYQVGLKWSQASQRYSITFARWIFKHRLPLILVSPHTRWYASSASSKRWQTRQAKDRFAVNAKVQGLKSRAAFKLLEVWLYHANYGPRANSFMQINEKYRIFHGGQTIVDLVNACRLGKTKDSCWLT